MYCFFYLKNYLESMFIVESNSKYLDLQCMLQPVSRCTNYNDLMVVPPKIKIDSTFVLTFNLLFTFLESLEL